MPCAIFLAIVCIFTYQSYNQPRTIVLDSVNSLGFAGSTDLWYQHLSPSNSQPDYCTSNREWILDLYSNVHAKLHRDCTVTRRIGHDADGGKILCLDSAKNSGCTVYSLGSRLDFSFEKSILEVFDCEVHTFDCTVGKPDPSKIPSEIHFHPWCIGSDSGLFPVSSDLGFSGSMGQYYTLADAMSLLGHSELDLLKMDIERHEIAVIAALTSQSAPQQVVFETHLHNAYGMWGRPMSPEEWEAMWDKLSELGYQIFSHEPNELCLCCSEWSLLKLNYT